MKTGLRFQRHFGQDFKQNLKDGYAFTGQDYNTERITKQIKKRIVIICKFRVGMESRSTLHVASKIILWCKLSSECYFMDKLLVMEACNFLYFVKDFA